MTALVVDGIEESFEPPVRFDFDTEFGGLAIDTPCGTLLGSFSLLDDGRAGLTLAGQAPQPCTETAQQDLAVLTAVLAEVSSWTESGGDFELRGQADGVILSR